MAATMPPTVDRARHDQSFHANSVEAVTGRSPRAARSSRTPGRASSVPGCPRCRLTTPPAVTAAALRRTTAAPGSVKSRESTSKDSTARVARRHGCPPDDRRRVLRLRGPEEGSGATGRPRRSGPGSARSPPASRSRRGPRGPGATTCGFPARGPGRRPSGRRRGTLQPRPDGEDGAGGAAVVQQGEQPVARAPRPRHRGRSGPPPDDRCRRVPARRSGGPTPCRCRCPDIRGRGRRSGRGRAGRRRRARRDRQGPEEDSPQHSPAIHALSFTGGCRRYNLRRRRGSPILLPRPSLLTTFLPAATSLHDE